MDVWRNSKNTSELKPSVSYINVPLFSNSIHYTFIFDGLSRMKNMYDLIRLEIKNSTLNEKYRSILK